MKNLKTITIILSFGLLALVLTACEPAVQEQTNLKQQQKEKCAKYLTNGLQLTEELRKNLPKTPSINVQFKGVFYSKAQKTCIAVIWETSTDMYFFYDALTGAPESGDKESLDLIY